MAFCYQGDRKGFEEKIIPIEDSLSIRSIAVSTDGKYFATAHSAQSSAVARGYVAVWEAKSGKNTAKVNVGPVAKIAFSPDGNTIAAGGMYLSIVEIAKKKPVKTFSQGGVVDLAFSPNGKSLATCHKGKSSVFVWDPASGKLVAELKWHSDSIHSLAFSGDGKNLASAGWGGDVVLWDTGRWEKIGIVFGNRHCITRFSPNDSRWLFVSGGERAAIWDNRAGKFGVKLDKSIYGGLIKDAAYSSDGKYLVTADSETLAVIDPESGKRLASRTTTSDWPADGINTVNFLPSEKSVVFGDREPGRAVVRITPIEDLVKPRKR